MRKENIAETFWGAVNDIDKQRIIIIQHIKLSIDKKSQSI